MVVRRDGQVELLDTGHLPIGIDAQPEYESLESRLSPGDKLIMYTDGISESHKGRVMYGLDGLQATLEKCGGRAPEDILNHVYKAAMEIAIRDLEDDAAMVIIGRDK